MSYPRSANQASKEVVTAESPIQTGALKKGTSQSSGGFRTQRSNLASVPYALEEERELDKWRLKGIILADWATERGPQTAKPEGGYGGMGRQGGKDNINVEL